MDIILRAENISRTYQAGAVKVNALKNCNVSVEHGQFVAVIGKSGSGKSTLLRILASMDRPDSGTVSIDGKDIFSMKDKKISAFRREKIGFVYQDYSLFPEFTSFENIIMPYAFDNRDANETEIDEILEQLGIAHCKNKYPEQMSGGEQQRVAIARALATHPAVIFADEPTGNLDADSANNVAQMLSVASQKYGQTIIMVTHDKQMADYADRILTIVDGNITE
jgi:putative ABC transport system ATP-binding protein